MDQQQKITALAQCGIPEHLAHLFGEHLLGGLIPKLGISFTEISPERTVATMPVEGNTQPMGLLHGGASAALVETLGSFAANAHAAASGLAAVGLELNITHLAPASAGQVRGVCTALKLGRQLCLHRVEIYQEDRLISSGQISNLLVARRP